MSFFTQSAFNDRLYTAAQTAGDQGYVSFVLPPQAKPPGEDIKLEEALYCTELLGSFTFSAAEQVFHNTVQADAFVDAVTAVVQASLTARAFLWLVAPEDVRSQTVRVMPISEDGLHVAGALEAPITPSLSLQVPSGTLLTLPPESTDLLLTTSGGSFIRFVGPSAPEMTNSDHGTLPFAGGRRGCVLFRSYLERRSLYDQLSWGFQFLYAEDGEERLEWQPLANPIEPNPSDMIGFDISVDPSDVYNAVLGPDRTALTFIGLNFDQQASILVSYYRTVFGAVVTLVPVPADDAGEDAEPARLVFHLGIESAQGFAQFQVAPEGDFILEVDPTIGEESWDLMCGLSGTELISFQPKTDSQAGDRLRFTSRRPAYAPNFPFEQSSPVGPPVDPLAKLLDSTRLTSWATVRRASTDGAPHYAAQPQGSAFYGQDTILHPTNPDVLGPMDPGYALSQNDALAFPMPPYAGTDANLNASGFNKEEIEEYESQVIAPTRRQVIAAAGTPPSASRRASFGRAATTEEGASFNVTTPSGVIANIDAGNGEWNSILLGQNTEPTLTQLQFIEPQAELQQAFQTNQVFAVAANAVFLKDDSGASFDNLLNVEDWVFQADVGENPAYNDYANVMIFKGRRGPIYDPDGPSDENLVANPDQWTQRNELGSPTVYNAQGELEPPDVAQQVILSQWLQTYFEDAAKETSPFFDNINRIARDPNWTGLLFLKANIRVIPEDLAGLTAGMNLDEFNAHHFGVEISPIDGATVSIDDSSSIFGLIYYVDEAYDPEGEEDGDPHPVPPPADSVYDFKVLTLKVLFRNTAVEDFKSVAQLTLNRFFAEEVDHMGEGGNRYNTIILRGSYQNNGGKSIYSLGSVSDSTFYFNSNILNKVEVTGVQMSTRDPGTESGTTVSWFALHGFIDYKVVHQTLGEGDEPMEILDVFSFGNPMGEDALRQGLSYTNLGISQSFPADDPTEVVYLFDTGEISFDLTISTPRPESLFVNFSLELQGLVEGSGDDSPASLGYSQLITDFRLTGVEGGPWYGLNYRLSMGSPGELAGKVGLDSNLLTAWAPGSAADSESYRALVGLELPGTGGGANLISLQTVLTLSVGLMRLLYDAERNSFLLLLHEIALKFLGILKIPPNGSSSFYLFGNPQSGGNPTGLGWYAVYKQDDSASQSTARALTAGDTEGRA